MNKIKYITIFLLLISTTNSFATSERLPSDFIKETSRLLKLPSEYSIIAGGKEHKEQHRNLTHYPVIMIPGNKRTKSDWMGANPGNAKGETNVYNKLINAGFTPQELWLYQYTGENKEMQNIEILTDDLKWFIYALIAYTQSSKIQILAHGEGALLAHTTIKKYNLFNLIHSVVYINAPFHGSHIYSYRKALLGVPVSTSASFDSDLLEELSISDETPYNIFENEQTKKTAIKYMTIYNPLPYKNSMFLYSPESPSLNGALNHKLTGLNHNGLRCSDASSSLFIPFFSDKVIQYDASKDYDKDGFMSTNAGGTDCDDGNINIYPGAPEIMSDNIDQDCNDMDLLPISGKECLVPIIIKKN